MVSVASLVRDFSAKLFWDGTLVRSLFMELLPPLRTSFPAQQIVQHFSVSHINGATFFKATSEISSVKGIFCTMHHRYGNCKGSEQNVIRRGTVVWVHVRVEFDCG